MTDSKPASQAAPAQSKKFPLITRILIVLGLIVLALVGLVALQPAEFHIERSTRIAAPPASAFAQVNDFHNWDAWSPWAKLDPSMKTEYSGPTSGEGASYSWVGNNEVGEGRMTIVESKPDELVNIKLEFLKPMEATNTAKFAFKPEGDETLVTWSMDGKNTFITKAFHLVMNMDKMIGGQFEQGLAALKAAAESGAKQ